ncbi:CoA transferase [Roseomonas sp. SSH11]|uniref:CoA transferase n=1 Tax=Pararoseomonas baculiformis TaxID=2820812 RepID=A0ABS4AJK1_9PROT|nr:CoA transferase [Pararoseomonas baculiformis]
MVAYVTASHGFSERRACALTRQHRSTQRKPSRRDPRLEIRQRMHEIARVRIRYGYRRLHVMLRRDGWAVGKSLVWRLYREEGLALRSKQPRRRKTVVQREARCVPKRPNEAWSLDFIQDQLSNGQTFRALTVVDVFSREGLAIEVWQRLRGEHAVEVLNRLVGERGAPKYLSADNGAEFTGRLVDLWAYHHGTRTDFSLPGKPTDEDAAGKRSLASPSGVSEGSVAIEGQRWTWTTKPKRLTILGADVIKVEPVNGGDDTRAWAPQKEGQSATFMALNRNKRSLALDLKCEAGRAIVYQLAAEVDVVIRGVGGGTARKLGVDSDTLRAINPRLIYCEISGFGRSGPLGDQPGYDVMLQAFSGMISTMGQPDGPFARASFSPVDLGTGMFALSGILAALLEREQTGQGAYVELSLLDTAMGLMTYLAQNYWLTGKPPQRVGTAHPSLAPYQAFDAADGSLMIGAGNDAQWRRLCALLELEELAGDPRFASNNARVANFAETVRVIQERVMQQPVSHWQAALGAAGVPCDPIRTLDEALAHPQLASRNLVLNIDHPVLGPMPQIGFPVAFDGVPREGQLPPPLHGQHTAEILRGLGYDDATIVALGTQGAIYMPEAKEVSA